MTSIYKLFLSIAIVLIPSFAVSQSVNEIIQDYLSNNLEKLGVTAEDVDSWVITNEYYSSSTQLKHVYIRQTHQGIAIANGLANFNILNGEVVSMGNRLVSEIKDKANSSRPVLKPIQAIEKAAIHLDIQMNSNIKALSSLSSTEFIFEKDGVSLEDIPVQLVYYLTSEGELRLAWDLSISMIDNPDWWSIHVDANTGGILNKNNWMVHCEFPRNHIPSKAHKDEKTKSRSRSNNFLSEEEEIVAMPPVVPAYNVFKLPIESPVHGARQLVSLTTNPAASPYGWHDTDGEIGAEYTYTRGNNVFAYEDMDDDNFGSPDEAPDGTATLTFDFPFVDGIAPEENMDAAITNLFYMNNMMHDIWYGYGFDEPSGNFQKTNYNNEGGFSNDYVQAEAMDGSGTNNANFSTPEDGSRPRMQMFLWSPSSLNDFEVNSPPSEEALNIVYDNGRASFGPDIPTTPITADLVLVTDGQGDDPYDACQSIDNGDELVGKIAVIRRGTCLFVEKVSAAQEEGAIAVIIINNVPGGSITMGGSDNSINIPTIMLSLEQGEAIMNALEEGDIVNGTIVEGDAEIIPFDSDFDNGIIAHEYGHGISIRLTGGPGNSNCLYNAEQMGEGWSDWFGMMVTMQPGDVATDIRGVGAYVRGQEADGYGIRPAPYTTDSSVNDFTYADTNMESLSEPHGIGFVWASMLWDLNWAFIDRYGFDPDVYSGSGGNNMLMQLVIDGLKMQPCSPGFIDGRDAILEADMIVNNGANQCMIWTVFANRGLGENASQGSSDSRYDQVESFVVPAIFSPASEYLICEGDSVEINGGIYFEEGVYDEEFTNMEGCDSVATYQISYYANASIDVDAQTNSLIAVNDNDGATYQWINCGSNTNIPFATESVYSPEGSGEFALIVEENGCTEMSECINFVYIGIGRNERDMLTIYPNPASDVLHVDFGGIKGVESFEMRDVQGREVFFSEKINQEMMDVDMSSMSNGVYLLKIVTAQTTLIYKVVKE